MHIYICMYVYIRMYVCMHECMHVCVCVCMYLHVYIYMHTYNTYDTYVYTYIYIHIIISLYIKYCSTAAITPSVPNSGHMNACSLKKKKRQYLWHERHLLRGDTASSPQATRLKKKSSICGHIWDTASSPRRRASSLDSHKTSLRPHTLVAYGRVLQK